MLFSPAKWATQGRSGHDIMQEDGDGDRSKAEDSAEVMIPTDVVEQCLISFLLTLFSPQMGTAGAAWASQAA